MLTTTSRFRQLASGYVRPVSYGVRASFDKTFDAGTTFFTLNTSVLDGTDLLAPSDDNPIQEWDRYAYANYDDRVISVEVVREETDPYSVTQAYADVVLNNYDGYFTPNGGSPIEDSILPRRPFRILMGFGGETVQQMVGLSDDMPKIDKTARTASFHIVDFMSYLFGKDIGETILLTDVTTGDVLDYLLQYMGLSPTQYELDDSLNTMSFFYVEKGAKFGDIATKLMEAEIGRLFLNEQGIIRFANRYNYDTTPVWSFDKKNTIDYQLNEEAKIINDVQINSDVRAVQSLQSVWLNTSTTDVPTGGSTDVFIDFTDPMTTIDTPVYSATEIADSYFVSVLKADGITPYTSVSVTAVSLFSKAAKLTFTNSGGSNATITSINVYGTPAKVIDTIKVEETDEDSIDKFENQLYKIDNPYIQDRDNAVSRALIILNDYKEYSSVVDIVVKGNSALQSADLIALDLDGFQGDYTITKMTNIIANGQLSQRITARKKTIASFFILDVSELDGGDLLGP